MDFEKTEIKKRRKRLILISRMYRGLQELVFYPYKCIAPLAMVFLFICSLKLKNYLFGMIELPLIVAQSINYTLTALLAICFVLFVLLVIKSIGHRSSQKDENHLICGLDCRDVRGWHPILFYRRTNKKTKVTTRVFHTYLTLERCYEIRDKFETALDVTLVAPYIEYGGKKKNSAHFVVLYSIPKRGYPNRGELQDDEF